MPSRKRARKRLRLHPIQRQYERSLQRFGVKRAARYLVRACIRAGLLTRPERCTHCSLPGTIQAHHEDYTRPLDVIWLCKERCHGLFDRRRRERERQHEPRRGVRKLDT